MTWGEVASIGFGLLGSNGGALWWAARWAINRLCGRLNAIAESIAEHRQESKEIDERHGRAIAVLQTSLEEQGRRIDEIREDIRDLRRVER